MDTEDTLAEEFLEVEYLANDIDDSEQENEAQNEQNLFAIEVLQVPKPPAWPANEQMRQLDEPDFVRSNRGKEICEFEGHLYWLNKTIQTPSPSMIKSAKLSTNHLTFWTTRKN